MSKNTIITIGRQYGSGGREIGQKLAEKLGIAFYDKELLAIASKKSGIHEDLLGSLDEKPTSSLLYSLVMGTYTFGAVTSNMDMPINDKLFIAQCDVMKEIAQKESAVIVGRCADYILRDVAPCINLFFYADFEKRAERIARTRDLTMEKAKELITKTDKQRASYYNFYSSEKWGKAQSYHLCIDTASVGIDGTVELLKHYVDLRNSDPSSF